MPTSVLLAVLAAAGLLALAPALTRRHDVTEPAATARAASTARVLTRRRRRRTVPGATPVKPPRQPARTVPPARRPSPSTRRVPRADPRAGGRKRRPARRRPVPTALHRRRRVLTGLVVLNLVELAGVFLVGPGFWIGFAVTATALVADLAYLRHRAVLAARRRRALRRRLSWIAAEQAAVRREHERRAAEKEALTRRVAASRLDARRLALPRSEHYPRRRTGTSDR